MCEHTFIKTNVISCLSSFKLDEPSNYKDILLCTKCYCWVPFRERYRFFDIISRPYSSIDSIEAHRPYLSEIYINALKVSLMNTTATNPYYKKLLLEKKNSKKVKCITCDKAINPDRPTECISSVVIDNKVYAICSDCYLDWFDEQEKIMFKICIICKKLIILKWTEIVCNTCYAKLLGLPFVPNVVMFSEERKERQL